MITINIETGNAAFESMPGFEVARILRNAAALLKEQDDFVTHGEIFPLYDINGNKVGSVYVGE